MPRTAPLRTDCSQCAALCCLALAFDKGRDFAFDKNPGEPCRNLSGHNCAIHDDLTERGMKGCVAYDCLGAGNRVVQEVFDGRSWQTEPRLTRVMIEAFAAMREVHKRIDLLRAAGAFDLDPRDDQTRRSLLAQLETRHWGGPELNDFEVGLALEVDLFAHAIRDRLPEDFFEER